MNCAATIVSYLHTCMCSNGFIILAQVNLFRYGSWRFFLGFILVAFLLFLCPHMANDILISFWTLDLYYLYCLVMPLILLVFILEKFAWQQLLPTRVFFNQTHKPNKFKVNSYTRSYNYCLNILSIAWRVYLLCWNWNLVYFIFSVHHQVGVSDFLPVTIS